MDTGTARCGGSIFVLNTVYFMKPIKVWSRLEMQPLWAQWALIKKHQVSVIKCQEFLSRQQNENRKLWDIWDDSEICRLRGQTTSKPQGESFIVAKSANSDHHGIDQGQMLHSCLWAVSSIKSMFFCLSGTPGFLYDIYLNTFFFYSPGPYVYVSLVIICLFRG